MSPYEALRAALAAEVAIPGIVTKARLNAVLAAFPPAAPDDQYADDTYDPQHYE